MSGEIPASMSGATLETRPESVNAIRSGRRRLTDRRVWASLTALYLALWVSLFQVYDGGQFIDPFNHVLYLTSLLHDRDLDFANDIVAANTFDRQRRLELGRISPVTGMIRNNWPPGAALLWALAAVPVHGIAHVAARMLGDAPPARFAFTPMLTISLMTCVYGYFALWLSYRLARLRCGPAPAGAAAAVALACSPLPFHLFRCAAADHGLAAFAIAWWLWLCLHRWGAHPVRRALWLGIAGGVMILVRWQDAVFGLAGLAAVLPRFAQLTRRDARSAAAGLAAALLGLFSVLSVQMAVWRVLDGAWISSPHGAGYIHWDQPVFLALLFSGKGGMLSWHPAMILGVLGLLLLSARRPLFALGAWIALLLHLYICAAVDDWHGEWGIGNRRLTELLPLLVIGLAEIFHRLRGQIIPALLALILIPAALANWLFMLFGYRGPVGVFSPLNHDGFATLAHFWKPLWRNIAAHPAVSLIDNTFFAPWLDLAREPYLAQAGLFAAFLPVAVLFAGRRLVATPVLQRWVGPLLAVLLFVFSVYLLTGLRAPSPGVLETAALSAELDTGDPAKVRQVRDTTARLLSDHATEPAVFHRLLGLNQRARLIAGEAWEPEVGWRPLNAVVSAGPPFDKWVLTALLEVRRVEFTPGQRLPFELEVGDRGLVELYWQHCWDQRLMQLLFESLAKFPRDEEAMQVFFDLTDRTPVLWWSCQWYRAVNPAEAPTASATGSYFDEVASPPSGSAPANLDLAFDHAQRLLVHNPLDLQALDQLIRTLRLKARTDPFALNHAIEVERLARAINEYELARLTAALESPLYERGFLEDRLNYYLGMPYH